ncbi:MAG: DoxX family protein [Thermoleophilaceae bacterium]|nr:DoxX family protein [Thermoleophilaceae bacterium]
MDIGLLALHAIPGALFVGHGAQKLFGLFGGHGIDGTGGFFESLGLRPGRVHATAAGLAEFGGGLLLLLGLLTPLAAAAIIATMVTASLTAHRGKGVWSTNGGWELPLVFGTIAFALAGVGAGDVSLDNALGLDVAGTAWALGALGAGLVGGLGAIAAGRIGQHGGSPAHPQGA